MVLCPAQPFDINAIMAIEHAAFIPQIQEKQAVFEERLRTFPEGFLVLNDSSAETVRKAGKALTAGYFCAERWNTIPDTDESFILGHDASHAHHQSGPVLYVSSFALLPEYRGHGTGSAFFHAALQTLCSRDSSIKTVLLLVNSEWQRAYHLYESLGFKQLRTIPLFFPSLHQKEGSDGILMTCAAASFDSEPGEIQ